MAEIDINKVRSVAQEAYRLGYRRGVNDHASGSVKLVETSGGYVIEEAQKEEIQDVPEDAAAVCEQGD